MTKAKKSPKPRHEQPRQAAVNGVGSPSHVLTLPEAAAYLRLHEEDVVRLVNEQGLPSRRLGNEWRFLKAAIDRWLSNPTQTGQGIWAAAGVLKDDPYLEQMLAEIERMRGRPAAVEN